MTIAPTIAPDSALQLIERFDRLQSWRIGQQMRVTALSHTEAGRATLLFGDRALTARTDQPIRRGEKLTVEVSELDPEPVLRVIARHAQTAPQTPPNMLNTALRSLMPRQSSLGSALAALAALSGQLNDLSPELRKQVETLLQRLPTSGDLRDPVQLRQLIRDSGLFLEARVVTGGEAFAGMFSEDLKAQLIRLRASLDAASAKAKGEPAASQEKPPPGTTSPLQRAGMPPAAQPRVTFASALTLLAGEGNEALWRLVDGAVSRLVLHQSLTVEQQLQGEPRWLLELPVRTESGIDTIPMQIHGPPRDQEAGGANGWTVELSLDLPNLGPLQIHVGLIAERLSATLWSPNPETVALIESHLAQLREHLNSHVEAVDLACHLGEPPVSGQTPRLPTLVDEWA